MVDNIYRVLAEGGVFVCISAGPPETRMGFFNEKNWTIETASIPKEASEALEKLDPDPNIYIYVCTKPVK